MSSSYGALNDATSDRDLEGFVEGDTGIASASVQHQVERGGSGTVMAFLPIFQGVSPETPEFWGERRNLEPVMAHEEEVVRAPSQPVEVTRIQRITCPLNEGPNEYFSKDFGGYACGYVQ